MSDKAVSQSVNQSVSQNYKQCHDGHRDTPRVQQDGPSFDTSHDSRRLSDGSLLQRARATTTLICAPKLKTKLLYPHTFSS